MTKRPFYKRYSEAVYMRDVFGIRFIVYPSKEQAEEYESEEPWDWQHSHCLDCCYDMDMIEDALRWVADASPGKIYVHPDDVGFYEARVGDLGEKHIMYTSAKGVVSLGEVCTENVEQEDLDASDVKMAQIIQRGGQSLIWPEWEEPEEEKKNGA